jgi:hypothetical protein
MDALPMNRLGLPSHDFWRCVISKYSEQRFQPLPDAAFLRQILEFSFSIEGEE